MTTPLSLLRHPALWRAADAPHVARSGRDGIATGFAALDSVLPDGGWPASGLAELLYPQKGCGEAALLLPLLRQLSAQPRWLVWINPPWLPLAPALARQGVALDNTLVLRCGQDRDLLWAMEQCLASGSCSLVQGWPVQPKPEQLRRLQLAAQKGHSLGLLLRPSACAKQPSPAPLRLELGARQGAGVAVRVVKCRGGWGSDWVKVPVVVPVVARPSLAGALSVSMPAVPDTSLPAATEALQLQPGMMPALAFRMIPANSAASGSRNHIGPPGP